jgi:hypothetical protein
MNRTLSLEAALGVRIELRDISPYLNLDVSAPEPTAGAHDAYFGHVQGSSVASVWCINEILVVPHYI